MREMTPEQEARLRAKAQSHVDGVVSKLSPMQRTFLVEYLVTSNATQAAETAGYANPNSQGSRLLSYEKIQAAISEYFFGPEMTAKEVVQRLGQQGRAEYADYLSVGEGYLGVKELRLDLERLLADGMGHLIKGFKATTSGQVVEFHDAQSALVHIGRHYGIFTDNTDIKSGGERIEGPVFYLPDNGRRDGAQASVGSTAGDGDDGAD